MLAWLIVYPALGAGPQVLGVRLYSIAEVGEISSLGAVLVQTVAMLMTIYLFIAAAAICAYGYLSAAQKPRAAG